MRNNVKLAWIISGLVLGVGMLFACPTPVPKLSPLLVPVNSSSVAALDFYIPQTDDDTDTYDIVTGDPTITAVTPSPADANSPENGGTWDGVATIAWSKPGKYNVAVTISATWWDEEKEVFCDTSYTKTFQVTVVDVKLSNTDEEDFFRSTTKTLQFTVTPPECADLLNVSLTGPDDAHHWTATYDPSSQKINLANNIAVNNPTAWVINQVSLIGSATLTGLDYVLPISKLLDLKKDMNDLRPAIRDSFADTAATLLATEPGNQVATAVWNHMRSYGYQDSTEHFQVFDELRAQEMSDEAKRGTDQAWGTALGTQIPRLIISQDINPYTLDESWTWQWHSDWKIITRDGQFLINSDLSPGLNPLPGDLVKAANTYGWAGIRFRPYGFIITDGLSADGHVGHATYQGKLSPILAGGIASFEGDTTPPKLFHGGMYFIGIKLVVSFWF